VTLLGRTVRVGDVDLHFNDRAALEARIDAQRCALLEIEKGPLTNNPRDLSAWSDVEMLASKLHDLLSALDVWVADDEASLDQEIEAARQSIRQLGTTVL